MLTSTGQLSKVGWTYVTGSNTTTTCSSGSPTTSKLTTTTTKATTTTTTTSKATTTTASSGAATYVGCYTDQGNPRTLASYSTTSTSNTNAQCESTCFGKGYTFAGTGELHPSLVNTSRLSKILRIRRRVLLREQLVVRYPRDRHGLQRGLRRRWDCQVRRKL